MKNDLKNLIDVKIKLRVATPPFNPKTELSDNLLEIFSLVFHISPTDNGYSLYDRI
jgi:hypothetical protein